MSARSHNAARDATNGECFQNALTDVPPNPQNEYVHWLWHGVMEFQKLTVPHTTDAVNTLGTARADMMESSAW